MSSDVPRPEHHSCHECSSGCPGTLTPAQLMERLQVSENVVYWELKHGFLRGIAFRVGRQWRVSEAAFERLMAGGDQ